MDVSAWSNGLILKSGAFKGYHIYVFTYVVGHFAFQLTFPKWSKQSRKRPPLPFLTQSLRWDQASIPIWPDVTAAEWPPALYLDSAGLQEFRNRFAQLQGGIRLPT